MFWWVLSFYNIYWSQYNFFPSSFFRFTGLCPKIYWLRGFTRFFECSFFFGSLVRVFGLFIFVYIIFISFKAFNLLLVDDKINRSGEALPSNYTFSYSYQSNLNFFRFYTYLPVINVILYWLFLRFIFSYFQGLNILFQPRFFSYTMDWFHNFNCSLLLGVLIFVILLFWFLIFNNFL